MSVRFYTYFVRFCRAAAKVNSTSFDCEAYRLRVAALSIFEIDDETPLASRYTDFVEYYAKVFKNSELDIDDVVYALCYIRRKYYEWQHKESERFNTGLLREIFLEMTN